MRKKTITLVVGTGVAATMVALLGSIWLRAVSLNVSDPAPVTPIQDHANALEPERSLVLEALRGSPKAAGELIDFYDQCSARERDEKGSAYCLSQAERWLEIGLQNGSPTAAQTKVMFLLRSTDCIDIYRAEFWYERYKSAGFGDQAMWKADAAEIAEKKRNCAWKS